MVEAVRLVRASVDVLLESTPPDVDLGALRPAITGVPGVAEVHDLHVWSLSSEVRALSAHLVLTGHPTLEEAQAGGRGGPRTRSAGPSTSPTPPSSSSASGASDEVNDPCAMRDAHRPRSVRRDGDPAVTANGARTRRSPE